MPAGAASRLQTTATTTTRTGYVALALLKNHYFFELLLKENISVTVFCSSPEIPTNFRFRIYPFDPAIRLSISTNSNAWRKYELLISSLKLVNNEIKRNYSACLAI